MSIVSVDFDGKPVNLDPSQLLDLKNASSDLQLILGGALQSYLDQPLSSVPPKTSADLSLNAGNPSWQLAGSPAKFSLGASAKFTVTIQQPNQTLFSYNPDLENSGAQKVNITGKAGSCYVIIEALFNISGSLSASVPVGSIGITTSDSASGGYTVRNYKALDPSTSLRDALLKAIGGFTLPLHQSTAANLSDGDCIFYEFDGAINVGFGATWGISTQVGATAVNEINQSLQKAGGIVSVSGLQPVTVSAGANVSMQFNWTRTFQCFLERQQASGQGGGALLHISAGKTSKRVLQMGIDAEIKGIGTPKAVVDANKATQLVLQKLGAANLPGASAIGPKVQQAVNPYVSDVNNWLSGLTQKVSTAAGKGVALSFYYQNQSSFTSAFTWHFDFANAQAGAAWEDAMSGDFLKALATNAVTLDPGSGYEQSSMRATGISLTLFGIWQFGTLEQFFDNATVSYVGNGQFHLEYKAGQTVTTTANQKVYTSSLYLAATATGSGNAAGSQMNLANVDLQLHGELSVKSDPEQQMMFGTLLIALGSAVRAAGGNGDDLTQLGNNWKAAGTLPQGALNVVYAKSALLRLAADAHNAGQKAPFPHDAANWKNYSSASDAVDSEPVEYFRQQGIGSQSYGLYDSWRKFNCAVNGYVTNASDSTPQLNSADRSHPAMQSPLSNAVLALMRQPGYFPGTGNDQDVQLGVYFAAGQEYMNLCGDVQALLQLAAANKLDWQALMSRMKAIAGNDINAWFGPVILLALAASSAAKSAAIQGNTLTSTNATATVNLS